MERNLMNNRSSIGSSDRASTYWDPESLEEVTIDVSDLYWSDRVDNRHRCNVQYLHQKGYFSDGFGTCNGVAPSRLILAGQKLQGYLRVKTLDQYYRIPRPGLNPYRPYPNDLRQVI